MQANDDTGRHTLTNTALCLLGGAATGERVLMAQLFEELGQPDRLLSMR